MSALHKRQSCRVVNGVDRLFFSRYLRKYAFSRAKGLFRFSLPGIQPAGVWGDENNADSIPGMPRPARSSGPFGPDLFPLSPPLFPKGSGAPRRDLTFRRCGTDCSA
jgi:hypothetical protein